MLQQLFLLLLSLLLPPPKLSSVPELKLKCLRPHFEDPGGFPKEGGESALLPAEFLEKISSSLPCTKECF